MKLIRYCASLSYNYYSLVDFLLIAASNAIAGDTIGQRRGTAIYILAHPGFPPVPLDVCVVVEVGEEQDERDGVRDERVVHPLGEVAVDVQGVDGVDDGQAELQLQVGVERWQEIMGFACQIIIS